MESVRSAVVRFKTVWFPDTGENQPFWFRARQEKFKTILTDLSDACIPAVNHICDTMTPVSLLHACNDWTVQDLLILSIMLDQVPRNALAIGYGSFARRDPLDVKSAIDDTFSLAFAKELMSRDYFSVSDERIICFYSLVYRHANLFDIARIILLSLSPKRETMTAGDNDPESLGLPPLAAKFWLETAKREKSLSEPLSH